MTNTPETTGAPPLRIAIIGAAAGIALTHLQAIARLPGAQLVGMADIAAEAGAARAQEHGCPFFTDHRTMLAEIRPDLAVITTPHPFHASIAIDCFEAGSHVLVEKPLAVEVAEADAMVAAAERAGKLLAVNYQQRFRPAIERAKALVDSGELGELVRVLCVEPWFRTQYYYDSAAWRGTWKGEGGGVLMNQGPHPLDLLCHLAGPPKKVWGWIRTLGHRMECEDSAQAMLEYPNGAPGYLYFSTVEAGVQRRMQIVGDRAAVELVEETLTIYRFSEPLSQYRATKQDMWGRPATEVETVALAGDGGGHLAVYQDLAAAIAEGRQPRCNGREGTMSLELANAVIYSSLTERPVTLPLDRGAYSELLADLRAGKRRLADGATS
ncbi:MAG: Gfo/Idh/MocA family oxidoreductase [Chloroflexota bacterium]